MARQQYNAQFDRSLVPPRYEANPKVGKWLSAQDYHYKFYQDGKPTIMTAGHIREVESIGFEWEPNAEIWSVR